MLKKFTATIIAILGMIGTSEAAQAQYYSGHNAPYYGDAFSQQQQFQSANGQGLGNYEHAPGLVNNLPPAYAMTPVQTNGRFTPVSNGFNHSNGFNQMSLGTQVSQSTMPQMTQGGSSGFDGGMSASYGSISDSSQQGLSPYERQQMAIQQSQMMQQMEELKQQSAMDDNYRLSGDLDKSTRSNSNGASSGKGVLSKVGQAMKGSMKYAAPAAGTVGSFFLLRAAMQGSSTYVLPGGSTVFVP